MLNLVRYPNVVRFPNLALLRRTRLRNAGSWPALHCRGELRWVGDMFSHCSITPSCICTPAAHMCCFTLEYLHLKQCDLFQHCTALLPPFPPPPPSVHIHQLLRTCCCLRCGCRYCFTFEYLHFKPSNLQYRREESNMLFAFCMFPGPDKEGL